MQSENHILFWTKMVKILTLFQTETANTKTIPFGTAHIYIVHTKGKPPVKKYLY